MAKPARRKCKICKEWFHPAFSNQWLSLIHIPEPTRPLYTPY
ncbi:recombination protein NinG, partial [Escherichia coli]